MHNLMRRIVLKWLNWLNWLAPFIWMAIIFWFSTDRFSGQETGSRFEMIIDWVAPWLGDVVRSSLHFLVRKLGHLTEYAILAVLWQRAFGSREWRGRLNHPRSQSLLILLLVAGYALVDEWHQTFTAYRSGSLTDCLIDFAGGVIGLQLASRGGRPKGKPARGETCQKRSQPEEKPD